MFRYCPQFDALFDKLTVREHLQLYARIKGVKEAVISAVVRSSIDTLGLTKFEHKQAGQLSGGNKRKLSVAIALMAEPPIVFLGTSRAVAMPRPCVLPTAHADNTCRQLGCCGNSARLAPSRIVCRWF